MAARVLSLDGRSYDPDALCGIEDHLLAAGCAAEVLALAEHFLPIERDDGGLMPHAVPDRCGLIFDLRAGRRLGEEPPDSAALEVVAEELCRDLGDEIEPDLVRHAAEIIVGRISVAATAREFDLVQGDIFKSDRAWQEAKRLHGVLMHVARDAGRHGHPAPGCALRGLIMMRDSVYDWNAADGKRRRDASGNLLDYLRPSKMEARIANSAQALIGANEPRASLILDGHEVLLRFAVRNGFFPAADAPRTESELRRLRETIASPIRDDA